MRLGVGWCSHYLLHQHVPGVAFVLSADFILTICSHILKGTTGSLTRRCFALPTQCAAHPVDILFAFRRADGLHLSALQLLHRAFFRDQRLRPKAETRDKPRRREGDQRGSRYHIGTRGTQHARNTKETVSCVRVVANKPSRSTENNGIQKRMKISTPDGRCSSYAHFALEYVPGVSGVAAGVKKNNRASGIARVPKNTPPLY